MSTLSGLGQVRVLSAEQQQARAQEQAALATALAHWRKALATRYAHVREETFTAHREAVFGLPS